MSRLFVAMCCAIAAVAALARPASALDPLPPSIAVVGFQQTRQYMAPLALCQADVLIGKYQTLLAGIEGGATVPAVIGFMGLPSDPGVRDLALITLAVATHEMDKQHPERRAVLQPFEKAAAAAADPIQYTPDSINRAAQKIAPGTCAGLAPIVVPTPDIYAISVADLKFAAKRQSIQSYLTQSMKARLSRIATALQADGSLTTSATVLDSAKSQLSDIVLTPPQMALLEYVAIQEALDGRLALGEVSAAVGALRNKQIPAYAEALRSIQATMPSPDSIVENIKAG